MGGVGYVLKKIAKKALKIHPAVAIAITVAEVGIVVATGGGAVAIMATVVF